MLAVFTQIAPFFAVVLLGWLAARPGALSKDGLIDGPGLAGLTAFVFKIALPPMLFLAMMKAPAVIGDGLDLLLGYAVSTLALYVAMRVAGRWLLGLRGGENTLFGYITINGNVGFLGLPLVALTLSEEAVLPTATILAFDSLVMMTATAMQLEALKTSGSAWRALSRALLNPVPIAVFSGFVWGFIALSFDVALPDALRRMLEFLASAAAPAALFATGAVLGRNQSDQRIAEVGAMTVAKLVLHPLLVAATLPLLVPDLPPLWYAAAVLAAACPASNNAVLLATNFGSYAARASAVALFSTALSVLTYAAAAAWLGSG